MSSNVRSSSIAILCEWELIGRAAQGTAPINQEKFDVTFENFNEQNSPPQNFRLEEQHRDVQQVLQQVQSLLNTDEASPHVETQMPPAAENHDERLLELAENLDNFALVLFNQTQIESHELGAHLSPLYGYVNSLLRNDKELRTENTFLNYLVPQVSRKIVALEQQIVQNQQVLQQTLQNANATVVSLQENNRDLKKRISVLEEENEALSENINSLCANQQAFIAMVVTQHDENQSLSAQLTALEEENKALSKSLTELIEKNQDQSKMYKEVQILLKISSNRAAQRATSDKINSLNTSTWKKTKQVRGLRVAAFFGGITVGGAIAAARKIKQVETLRSQEYLERDKLKDQLDKLKARGQILAKKREDIRQGRI